MFLGKRSLRGVARACVCALCAVAAATGTWLLVWGDHETRASLEALFGQVGIATGVWAPATILLAGMLALCVSWQALRNRFDRRFLAALVLAYVLALLAVVLLKSVGVRELNLDVSDVLAQAQEAPVNLLLNVAIFVPLGMLLRARVASAVRACLLCLVCSVCLELGQYALALGVADVVDVVVNPFGLMLGFLLADRMARQGLAVRRVDDWHVGIAREARPGSPGGKALALMALALVAVGAGALLMGAASWGSAEGDPERAVEVLQDETLSALPRSGGEETLVVTGVMLQCDPWLDEEGETCWGVSVLASESVGVVTVSTTTPMVVTSQTSVTALGSPAEPSDLADLFDALFPCEVTAEVVVEGGWLRVVSLGLEGEGALGSATPVATFAWESYTALLEGAAGQDDAAFVDGAERPLTGYVDSVTSLEGSASFATIVWVVLDDGVPGLRSVNATVGSTDSLEWGSMLAFVEYVVWCEDGSLVLV